MIECISNKVGPRRIPIENGRIVLQRGEGFFRLRYYLLFLLIAIELIPTSVYAQDLYCSIAVGKDIYGNLHDGGSWDYGTLLDAQNAAVNSCQQRGGIYNISVAFSAKNAACAIVMWDNGGYATGWGVNVNEAVGAAEWSAINNFRAQPGIPIYVMWVRTANVNEPTGLHYREYNDILPNLRIQTPNPNPITPNHSPPFNINECDIYDRNDPQYAECELRLTGTG